MLKKKPMQRERENQENNKEVNLECSCTLSEAQPFLDSCEKTNFPIAYATLNWIFCYLQPIHADLIQSVIKGGGMLQVANPKMQNW